MRVVAWLAVGLVACGGAAADEPRARPSGTDIAPLPNWAAEGPGRAMPAVTVAPAPAPALALAPARALAPAHGRAIDLDVRSADIGEVCRFIADAAGVNIVLGDGVTGTVTVRLKHVPWDTALDAILRAKGYRAERDGNIVTVLAK
jgi:type IV pilus assembly protein PilQ